MSNKDPYTPNAYIGWHSKAKTELLLEAVIELKDQRLRQQNEIENLRVKADIGAEILHLESLETSLKIAISNTEPKAKIL